MTNHHLPGLTQHISYSPLIFLLGLIIGVVLHVFVPLEFTNHTLRAMLMGVFLIAVAPLLLLWATNSHMPVYEQGNTSTDLKRGPYRYSRHPGYVSFLFMVLGVGLILNSVTLLIIAALLFLLFTFYIIPCEERLIGRNSPERYEAYKKQVAMWL